MKNGNIERNAQINSAAGMRRKRQAAKRKRRKKVMRLIRNWCILGLIICAAVIFMKSIKKPQENKTPNSNGIGSFLPVVNTGETKAADEETTTEAEPEPIKYAYEKPKVREGEEIRERLLELSGKYPEIQEIYDNMDAYPETLLAALCNNPDMNDFVKGYLTEEPAVKGGLTEEDMQRTFPLFLQWDRRWGYVHYGDDDIARSGCGPTCLSMVAAALTRDAAATPDKVAAYAEQNGYYQPNVGTAWSLMTEGAAEFGVRGEELILNKNTIFHALENGNPVICSVRQGNFTAAGHFIVLVGVKDGRLVVNDPNSTIRSSMLWDYEEIEKQISNLWVFYKR